MFENLPHVDFPGSSLVSGRREGADEVGNPPWLGKGNPRVFSIWKG